MGIVLVGDLDRGSKRTGYFLRAAQEIGAAVRVIPYEACDLPSLEGHCVKLDPPPSTDCIVSGLPKIMGRYQRRLRRLDVDGTVYLNSPKAILAALDKRRCKERLRRAGVPVTPVLLERVEGVEQLAEQMRRERRFQVFLKPVLGSGAAGVAAYRMQPATGRQMLYTSAVLGCDGRLINTKRMRCYRDDACTPVLEALVQLDCVAECWLPKAEADGWAYDLRLVCQFGVVDFAVGRRAKGPVTNLHLADGAVAAERLPLPEEKWEQVRQMGLGAAQALGLRSAGIDILLTKNGLEPYIIEVNGQGDLIYQDIYDANRIYRRQVEWMVENGGK